MGESEAIASALFSGFAAEIYKDVKGVGKKIASPILIHLQTDIEKYLVDRNQKNAKVKTLIHNSIPVKFYDIYEPINVRYEHSSTKFFDCRDIFKNGNYFTFFGPAGCGKTTLFKHLAYDCVKSKIGLPITIYLRNIENKEFKIFDLIREEIKSDMQDDLVSLLLSQGKIILFLDGYDETGLLG